jgi:uncharacterized protein
MTQKILLILSFFFLVVCANAQDALPKKVGIVNDFEDIFDKKQEKKIAQLIKKELKGSEDEIAVVTIASLGDFPDIEAYAEALLGYWNLGDGNGVLIVMGKGLRKVRIQYSAGIGGRLTDNESKKIIEAQIIPEFKAERHLEGILKGIEAIGKELK